MIRVAIVCLLLLITSLGFGQGKYSQKDRLGKSVEEVLEMGQDVWDDFYYSKVPFSGVTRGVAYDIYRDSLATRNALKLKKVKPTRKQKVLQTKKVLAEIYHGLAHVQYAFTGGNAWNSDSAPLEIEELATRLIVFSNTRREPSAHPMRGTVDSLKKEISSFFGNAPAIIKKKAANGELMVSFPRENETKDQSIRRNTSNALSDLSGAKKAYDKLMPLLGAYNQREAIGILNVVKSWCSI